jgi:cellulose biosynthesis protein BcsQ
MNGVEGQTKALLKRHLEELRKSYSYIVFDCAPGISALTTAAVALADLIIVPTMPDFLSHLGLAAFMKSILTEIGANEKRAVEKPHVLITRKRNTKQHNEYYQRIRAAAALADAPFKLFETLIPEAAAWPTALAMIDQYPTFSQKYPPPIGNTLASLADEINGAFREGHNRRV